MSSYLHGQQLLFHVAARLSRSGGPPVLLTACSQVNHARKCNTSFQ